jgi:predicted DNA-binding transcriptional regulator AlpA
MEKESDISELEQEQRNLLDAVEVGIMLGKGRDYVTRLNKKGKLPKPVKSVSRNMRWLADDIETWLSLGRPAQIAFEKWRKIHPGKVRSPN